MKKTKFRETVESLIWKWVYEELPKQFSYDKDDDIGHEVLIRFQSYEGGKSWIFESDGDELELGIGRDGTFIVTLSDTCDKTSVILFNVQEIGDIEDLKSVVYRLCDIFTTSGNWHALMDFVPSTTKIAALRKSIEYYDELNDQMSIV